MLLELPSDARVKPGESGRTDAVSEPELSGGDARVELVKVRKARQRTKKKPIDEIDGRDMGKGKETNLVKNFRSRISRKKQQNTWT
jgi:hypothetical protein